MVKKARHLAHPEGRRTVGHNERNGRLPLMGRENILLLIRLKVSAGMMHVNASGNRLRITTLLCIASMLGSSSVAAIKNMAVAVSEGRTINDTPPAEPVQL